MNAESSKQGKKKAKKQRLAAAAAATIVAARNGSLRISEKASNSSHRDEPNEVLNSQGMQDTSDKEASKNSRGKAKVLSLSKGKTKGSRVVVEFNLAGQPFREHAARFSSFLGITARELVPITLKSWNNLSDNFRNQIWEHVTQKFNLDDCHKKYTFQKLRKLWRDHRSNLVKMVMQQAEAVGLPRAATLLKPDSVKTMDEWLSFLKERSSQETRENSQKFKEMRAKKTLVHRTSRKSFARIEDELQQKSETLDAISRTDVWIYGYEKRKKNEDDEVEDPEIVKEVKKFKEEQGSHKCSIKEDAVVKVLGPDPRGRVRGMGFGATTSKMEGQGRARDQFNRLENKVIELEKQVTNLLNRIATGELNIEKENLTVQHSANESVQSKQRASHNVESSANEMAQGKQKENSAEHAKCKLLNWIGTSEVVGLGEIASTDPNSLVHHVPLGHECWKVWVNDVMDDNVTMYRPTREFFLLREALGTTIAWPIKYIKLC